MTAISTTVVKKKIQWCL